MKYARAFSITEFCPPDPFFLSKARTLLPFHLILAFLSQPWCWGKGDIVKSEPKEIDRKLCSQAEGERIGREVYTI